MPKQAQASIYSILQKKRIYILQENSGPFHIRYSGQPLGRLLFAEKGVIHIRTGEGILLVPSWYCAWIPSGMSHELWSNSREVFIRNVFFDSGFCKNAHFHRLSIFNGSELFRDMVRHTEKWNGNREENIYERSFLTVIRQMIPEEMQNAFRIFLRSSGQEGFQQVLEYVHQHYPENILITDLQKKTAYSLRTLQRLFETETGLSFSSYLKTIRVLKAIELLSDGGKTVSEVAWEVGYNSLPTFSHTFKEATGLAPDRFVKRKWLSSSNTADLASS